MGLHSKLYRHMFQTNTLQNKKMLRVSPVVCTVYTPHRRNEMVCKKEYGRVGEKKKKKCKKILLRRGRRKRKNLKEVSRETGVGGRNLPGIQGDDSQDDFPFASDW